MEGRLTGREWKIVKLRNEVSFAYSDMAMGGADHSPQIREFNKQIAELEKEGADNVQ